MRAKGLLLELLLLSATLALTVSPFQVQAKSPDLNGDGTVDRMDSLVLMSAFGSTPSDSNWNPKADLVPNAIIDIEDAIILSQNYGEDRFNGVREFSPPVKYAQDFSVTQQSNSLTVTASCSLGKFTAELLPFVEFNNGTIKYLGGLVGFTSSLGLQQQGVLHYKYNVSVSIPLAARTLVAYVGLEVNSSASVETGDTCITVSSFDAQVIFDFADVSYTYTIMDNSFKIPISGLASILLDPVVEFSTSSITGISMCSLTNHTFVIVYMDDTADDVHFQIYDTNGTVIVAETDVDTSAGYTGHDIVSVSAFNSSAFVICWFDDGDDDVTVQTWSSSGTNLTNAVDVDTTAGAYANRVSVSAMDDTTFAIGWMDYTDMKEMCAVYLSDCSLSHGPYTLNTEGFAASDPVMVTALSSTEYAVAWWDKDDGEGYVQVRNHTTNTTAITTIDFTYGSALPFQLSATDSTHFLLGIGDRGASDASWRLFTYTGSALSAGTVVDVDTAAGTTVVPSIVALNSTTLAYCFYDGADYDFTYAVYYTNGTAILAATDIETWPTGLNVPFTYSSLCGMELTNSANAIYNQNFIVAYGNTTTQAIWCAYWNNGTAWDGTLPSAGESNVPTSESASSNETKANYLCLFSVLWNDDTNVSGHILYHNNSGSWTAETWVAFSTFYNTTAAWANTTKTLNSTVGVVVSWISGCNDTYNNWANTSQYNVTTTFYAELTIVTGTHSWSITPGQSNVTITENTINITVTANANFDVQAKSLNATLISGSDTIALSNLLMHEDTLASATAITTDYQDIPGLTNEVAGTSQAKTFVLWLTCPNGTPKGTFEYTLSVKVIQA